MSKLTTALIKDALNKKIGNYNWKRITKRKFDYKNATIKFRSGKKIVLDGKLNWRAYMDVNATEPVYVIDNGEKILYMVNELPTLPSTCFQTGVYFENFCPTLAFFVRFNPEFEDVFPEELGLEGDDIREYTIAGLVEAFDKVNLSVTNEMENLFFVSRKGESKGYLQHTEENKQFIIDTLVNFGMTYNKDIEKEFD